MKRRNFVWLKEPLISQQYKSNFTSYLTINYDSSSLSFMWHLYDPNSDFSNLLISHNTPCFPHPTPSYCIKHPRTVATSNQPPLGKVVRSFASLFFLPFLVKFKFQTLATFKFHLVECTSRSFFLYRQSLLSSWFTLLHNVRFSPCFSFIFGLFCRFVAVLHFVSLFYILISV